MIIVAQRISTISHADQIIVLDEGKVAGIGTHQELLKTCEVYRQIGLSQMSGGGTRSMSTQKIHHPTAASVPAAALAAMVPPGAPMGTGEKAKEFQGNHESPALPAGAYKIAVFLVILFAIGSAAFSIIGPKVLGNATTEIFNGLMGKLSGSAGIDFAKIGTILLTLIGLYVLSSCSPSSRAIS